MINTLGDLCSQVDRKIKRACLGQRDKFIHEPFLQVVNTDYINASLLTCSAVDRSYILTQGPLQVTKLVDEYEL